jgi:hypothetical protein
MRRRHLLAESNGAYINGQNAGAIVNFNPSQTTWRDHAYNPVTGDLFTRESNRVGKAIRNGDNSFTTNPATCGRPLSWSSLLMP